MDCPNCGQNLDLSSAGAYVKCEYCRSTIAVVTPARKFNVLPGTFELSDERVSQINSLLQCGNIDLDNHNYESADRAYEKILSIEPTVWEALLNQAICAFWMGREDMSHMREVKSLLAKADKLSGGNVLVNKTKKDIAHNLAVIASKKERFGDGIQWSIGCFGISKALLESDPNRDSIIEEYCRTAFQEIQQRVIRNLARDKKAFDPNQQDLNSLCELAILTNGRNEDVLVYAAALSTLKIKKHPGKPELSAQDLRVKTLFESKYSGKALPEVRFPLIGSPKIVWSIN